MAQSDGARQRRLRHREHLRREILDAAGELFAEEGYERVTIRGIAERIHYSQGVVFYYFRNKADILAALCEETFEGLEERFSEIAGRNPDPVVRLMEASRAFVQFATTHPHHYRVVLTPPAAMDGVDSTERIGRLGGRLFEELGRLYRGCCEAGIFRPRDAFAAALGWWNCLSGLVVFFNMHREAGWVDRGAVLEHTLEVLEAGNRAGAGRGEAPRG